MLLQMDQGWEYSLVNNLNYYLLFINKTCTRHTVGLELGGRGAGGLWPHFFVTLRLFSHNTNSNTKINFIQAVIFFSDLLIECTVKLINRMIQWKPVKNTVGCISKQHSRFRTTIIIFNFIRSLVSSKPELSTESVNV